MDYEVVLLGLVSVLMILAGIMNWNWWFESRRVKFISKILTRNGARIFYVLFGLAAIIYGVLEF